MLCQHFKYNSLWYLRTFIDAGGKIWFDENDALDLCGFDYLTRRDRSIVKKESRIHVRERCYPGGDYGNMSLIDTAGLFSLIRRSKRPTIDEVESWVTNVVLPKLMLISSCLTFDNEDDEVIRLAKALVVAIINRKNEVEKLVDIAKLDSLINKTVNH